MSASVAIPAGISASLAQYQQGLETLYGSRLSRVVLFGSRARGDARNDSDIDVLIVLRGEVQTGREIDFTSQLSHQVCLSHGVVLLSMFVSEMDFQSRRTPLLDNIRHEGIVL